MIKVIGVRFRTAGKIYFFDPLDFDIKRGDHVIVETARGIEYGTVMSGVREVEDEKVVQPLKAVIRMATQRDDEQEIANKEREKEAYKVCLEKIRKHQLDMKLIDAEYTFDNNKVLFYFTADGRIDFRELVKDLAAIFKTRIELRQIGVRDETKLLGGIGICGRPLCCHSYLSDFVPVSIKMAKDQNLSLNPAKISGVCGRLMCCLKNEDETYQELNKHLPGVGDSVTTEDGQVGEVHSVNVLRQLVKVLIDDNGEKELKEFPADSLTFKRRHGKVEKLDLSKEELKELEKLEKEEMQASAEDENESRNDVNRQERRNNNKNRDNQDRENRNRNHDGQRFNKENRNKDSRDNYRENKKESRQDNRQENRRESHQDSRQENRRESYQDNRQETRPESKLEGTSRDKGQRDSFESSDVNAKVAEGNNNSAANGNNGGNRNNRNRNRNRHNRYHKPQNGERKERSNDSQS